MSALPIYALDIVLTSMLAFGVYYPRHHRRDLVVAFLGINIGVLAVAALLASSSVTAGLGLGLFGVLSIIRLRSDELSQSEIAYYFAFLALGLIAGLAITPIALTIAFMAVVFLTLVIVDHPSVLGGNKRTVMVVDRAIADEAELKDHLAHQLNAKIHSVNVQRIDQVSDTTWVDVRFQPLPSGSTHLAQAGHEQLSDIPREPSARERELASY